MFVFGMIAGTTPTTRYESQAGATGPQASFSSSDWRFGTASHNAGTGVAWINIGNILTENSQYAYVQASQWAELTSQYAVADGFGFSIPSDMVITGIQVSLKGYEYTPRGGATFERCYIEKAGVIELGQCRPVDFGPSNGWVTVGGPMDTWGLSWNVSDINSNNFGAGLLADLEPQQNAVRVYLDCIKIAVYYVYDPVPTIDHPSDVYYNVGTTGHNITWHVLDNNPTNYAVTKDGINVKQGSWTNGSITQSVDNLTGGTYTYTCTVYDGHNQQASDSVQVIVNPAPFIDHPSNIYYYEGDTGYSITWQVSDNNPANYTVTKDGITVQQGSWTNGSITRSVDNLPGGTYTYTCTIYDIDGLHASDDVQVEVNPITKYAVIVGIATYQYVGPNLNYPDDDADDWYNQLVNIGWSSSNIKMYGDGHLTATWSNVNDGLNWLGSVADANDIIAFIFSGHGDIWSFGGQYHPCLCCYDYYVVNQSGQYYVYNAIWDTDLADKLDGSQAAKIFVFLDSCFSGGFGDDLMSMSNKTKVFCTTTCTLYGVGYEDPVHENGEWTYYFLHYSWQGSYGGSAYAAMEDVFINAVINYQVWYYDSQHNPQHQTPPSSDIPQQFDGNPSAPFYLTYP